ncbi:MAG: hypothetical protein M8364_15970 [Methylobacter sp.]|uniref:hypothetical protein n=1 Tax=Methylobacter sp. TaxID=2051955 RepID=UPI00258EE9A2|nr:hypothetical protein [Methylobacter sp.]MCL7422389.1 hypothetical protein [Methylobacter sp.]
MKKITILIFAMGFSGCTAHWTNIDLKPDEAAPVSHYSGSKPSNCMAVMDDLRVTSNGQAANVNEAFQKRFITNLKDTHLFSTVTDTIPTDRPNNLVNFALSIAENQDTNQGANVTKGFFIGLSLYLLTPVIPLSYDFESDMTLVAMRSDGRSKRYTAKGKGEARYHLFANAAMAGEDVRSQITNNNLSALMNQISQDADFICGT